jgi:hypothetical protein
MIGSVPPACLSESSPVKLHHPRSVRLRRYLDRPKESSEPLCRRLVALQRRVLVPERHRRRRVPETAHEFPHRRPSRRRPGRPAAAKIVEVQSSAAYQLKASMTRDRRDVDWAADPALFGGRGRLWTIYAPLRIWTRHAASPHATSIPISQLPPPSPAMYAYVSN